MMLLITRVLIVFVMVLCWGHPYLNATEGQKLQEGQFAVQLTKRLRLATAPSTVQAIDILTKAEIIPRGGWQPAKPVDAELITRTQVPISNLLFQVSQSLGVPAPPTLSQVVLNPPYGPQTIGYHVADIRESKKTSQGAFAVKLVQKLKLAENPLSSKEAIALLSKIGITPKPIKDGPDGGWNSEAKATELFIVQVQIAILDVLKEVALQLNIPLPETIHIRVIVVN